MKTVYGVILLLLTCNAIGFCQEDTVDAYISLLQSRKFQELEIKLDQLENSKRKTLNGNYEFSKIMSQIGHHIVENDQSLVSYINEWCEADPKNYLAFTTRGYFYFAKAWDMRGSAFSKDIMAEQKKLFRENLDLASYDFYKAVELDLKKTEPLIGLQHIAQSAGNVQETKTYFDKIVALDPNHYTAYKTMLEVLKPKWGGSYDLLFQFARLSKVSHKDKPLFGLLVGEAHRDVKAFLKDESEIKKYFHQKVVWNEIKEIYERYLNEVPDANKVRNQYANFAYWAGQYRIAYQQFQVINGAWEEQVWGEKKFFVQVQDETTYQAKIGHNADPLNEKPVKLQFRR